MRKNGRATIGQRWFERIYTDKNNDHTKATTDEDKLKRNDKQDTEYNNEKTTDRVNESKFNNNSEDVFKGLKNDIKDKVQDNATENENDTRKEKLNMNKGNEIITKKSLLQEIFLSDIDNDKRKPLNLDCLVLKPEYAKKYKRLKETSLNSPSNKASNIHFDTKKSTCSSKSNDN